MFQSYDGVCMCALCLSACVCVQCVCLTYVCTVRCSLRDLFLDVHASEMPWICSHSIESTLRICFRCHHGFCCNCEFCFRCSYPSSLHVGRCRCHDVGPRGVKLNM